MKFHDLIRNQNGWELLSEEIAYANPFVQVRPTTIRTPTRPEGVDWTVVHRKGATVVAPLTVDGKFILIRQERVPIRATIWEFPAGQIDTGGEHDEFTIRATALRELREEAACELGPTGELIPLGLYFPSAGFTDEHCHLFLARNVVETGHGPELDHNEMITEARAFTLDEFRAMIASGEIRDANTLSTFARIYALGLLPAR